MSGEPLKENVAGSVKDQIVGILEYGATPISSVEAFLHGVEKRAVRAVIDGSPDLFAVFERGFPAVGPKHLWVRLKRTK